MQDAAEQLQSILDGAETRRRWGTRIRAVSIWITGLIGAASLAVGLGDGETGSAAIGAALLFVCGRLWWAESRDY